VIRGFHDKNYNEENDQFWLYTENKYLLHRTYMFNVVKECEDIYIEVRSCLDRELRMTIDAKKIIPKLSVPLEDKEWGKIKKYEIGSTN